MESPASEKGEAVRTRSFSAGTLQLVSVFMFSLCGVSCLSQSNGAPTAERPQTSTGSNFAFKTYSEEVMVDVVVNDSRGEPVRNLSREHFQLLENGRPQQVRFFQEHGGASGAQPTQASPALPEHVYTNVTGTEDQSAPVLLLMDGLNTPVREQANMRAQIRAYLKQIPPGTRMALFTLAPGLKMLTDFSTDTAGIKSVLESGKGIRPSGLLESDTQFDQAQPSIMSPSQTAQPDQDPQTVTEARRAARRKELRAEYTLEAFESLGKYLTGFPGRKSVIWFSGSFPLFLVPKTVTSQTQPSGGAAGKSNPSMGSGDFIYADFSEEVQRVTNVLAKGRVAVYPVDARGVLNDSFNNAENGGLGVRDLTQFNKSLTDEHFDFVDSMTAEHDAMIQIANVTGGKAFFNTNDLSGSLGKAIRDASSYYQISYIPDHHAFDERYHKIQVTLDVPGVKAAYREGYYADDPAKHPQKAKADVDPMKLEMEDGAPLSTQIQFYAHVVQVALQPDLQDHLKRVGDFGPKITGSVVRYGIDWQINLAGVQMTMADGGSQTGKVRFGAVAYDVDGKVRNALANVVEFNLTPERFAQLSERGLPLHLDIDLPTGDVVLRLALVDLISGRTGSMEIPLQVN